MENTEHQDESMPEQTGPGAELPQQPQVPAGAEQPTPPQSAYARPETQSQADIYTKRLDFSNFESKLKAARAEISKLLIGQTGMIDLIYAGMLANGHILLEGVPGIAKTLSAKLVARTIDAEFKRIQFTPDLMPSDISGSSVYNAQSGKFDFRKGPVFSNIVLIDEINRAPAKTQAALFEVMEERQLTYDGITYPMDFPFLVIATQNPIEQEGTYRLPEAQLDRFIFKVVLDYPSLQEEKEILMRFRNKIGHAEMDQVKPVLSRQELAQFRTLIEQVGIEDKLLGYIAAITDGTRNHTALYLGASPRASLAMLRASKALAAIKGRDFVIPEDIQYLSPYVLNHRILLSPEAEMDGITSFDVIQEMLNRVEVPR
jgi:MoxR-like ATPase